MQRYKQYLIDKYGSWHSTHSDYNGPEPIHYAIVIPAQVPIYADGDGHFRYSEYLRYKGETGRAQHAESLHQAGVHRRAYLYSFVSYLCKLHSRLATEHATTLRVHEYHWNWLPA